MLNKIQDLDWGSKPVPQYNISFAGFTSSPPVTASILAAVLWVSRTASCHNNKNNDQPTLISKIQY